MRNLATNLVRPKRPLVLALRSSIIAARPTHTGTRCESVQSVAACATQEQESITATTHNTEHFAYTNT